MAWMNERDAGYPIGGSQAIIRLIVESLRALGGRLQLAAKAERTLLENGVQLVGGVMITADRVISAADGHATIYGLPGPRYTDEATDKNYATLKPFPSYLQVSPGVARGLPDPPLTVDPGAELSLGSFRFFYFDPAFAPAGKTAVTCFLPMGAFEYRVGLPQRDPARYEAENPRIGDSVIGIPEGAIVGVHRAIEAIDVSTPKGRMRRDAHLAPLPDGAAE